MKTDKKVSGQSRFMDLLRADDKLISESKNFITLLVRRIMVDCALYPRTYIQYLEKWLARRYSETPEGIAKRSTARNNFMKEISNDAITPKVFQKFTQTLGATRVKIMVEMEIAGEKRPLYSEVTFINPTETVDKDDSHYVELE